MIGIGINRTLWLVPVFFTVHNMEEYFNFPLVMRSLSHFPGFSAMSKAQMLYAIIFLTVLVVLFTYLGTKIKKNNNGIFIISVILSAILANAFLHTAVSIWFGEYMPGVISAVVLFVPFSVYLLRRAVREGYLSTKKLTYAFLLGLGLHFPLVQAALIISSLIENA